MVKLKVYLKRVKNVILFDVLEQDKSLTSNLNKSILKFKASNGISIISNGHQELRDDSLFISGLFDEKKKNRSMSVKVFKTEKEAKIMFDKYIQALKEFKYNNYFEGHGSTEKIEKEEEDVYIF